MPRATALAALAFALGAALTSCTSIERNEITDIANVCVSSANGSGGATTELAIDVEFMACLSSSCDTLVASSCEASVSGAVIEVSGLAEIDSQVGGACTLDCGIVEAQCPLEVDNGIYTVRFGEAEFEYEVGTPAACAFE